MRFALIICAGLLFVGCLAGCGGGSEEPTAAQMNAAAQNAAQAPGGESPATK